MDLFSFIENAFTKSKTVKSFENQLNDSESYFMSNRWLSMSPFSFIGSYKASRFSSGLPRWALGCIIFHSIKKNKFPKITYIKKDKEIKDKELLEKISQFFNCSEYHAGQIYEIYEAGQINIRGAFGLK